VSGFWDRTGSLLDGLRGVCREVQLVTERLEERVPHADGVEALLDVGIGNVGHQVCDEDPEVARVAVEGTDDDDRPSAS
jgi:hypothetical protein